MDEKTLAEMLDDTTEDDTTEPEVAVPLERLWKFKERFLPPHFKEFYTDEELVDLFLSTTYYWYTDPENCLFGWKDRIRQELIRCLKEDANANAPHQLIYAQGKFQNEWIGPNGMYEPINVKFISKFLSKFRNNEELKNLLDRKE